MNPEQPGPSLPHVFDGRGAAPRAGARKQLGFLAVRCLLAFAAITSASGGSAQAESYDCLIDPARVVNLGSPMVGLLSEVLVERGDVVTRGQIVARLESSVEAATLAYDAAQAKNTAALEEKLARLALAQKALERARALAQTQNIARKGLDEAEAEVRVLTHQVENEKQQLEQKRLELSRAQAVLDLKTIRSPEAGVVVERKLSAGEYVYQQGHIATIARLDELRVETFLPVSLFGRIREGDTAVVEPQAPAGGAFPAKVSVIDRVFDAASATFGVRLALPNFELELPAGLRCKVSFTLRDAAPLGPGVAAKGAATVEPPAAAR